MHQFYKFIYCLTFCVAQHVERHKMSSNKLVKLMYLIGYFICII